MNSTKIHVCAPKIYKKEMVELVDREEEDEVFSILNCSYLQSAHHSSCISCIAFHTSILDKYLQERMLALAALESVAYHSNS